MHWNVYEIQVALGAVMAAIELYYSLQVLLPLPSIERLDEFAEEYKINNSVTLLVKTTRVITAPEYQSLEKILSSMPGGYPLLVSFPDGSDKPGIQAHKKTAFSYDLLPQIKALDFVENYPGDQSAVSTIWFPKKINLYGSENFVSDNIGVFTGIFNFIYSNGRRDSSLN
jgi:hypothetical protein